MLDVNYDFEPTQMLIQPAWKRISDLFNMAALINYDVCPLVIRHG
jgi:hypothetical protein